jgi:hypothetical protein
VASEAHALDLMRALDHAATGGDGSCGDEFQMRVGGTDAFGEGEGHVLVQTDAAGAEMAISETAADEREGAFVFLPGKDVSVICDWAGGEKFVGAAFFEGRTDEEGFGSRRKNECPKAFASVEREVSEVDGRAGGISENDGVDSVLRHQFAGALYT